MIAFVEAHRAGLLARAHWLPNLAAGLVVGVVALPLAMAFAIASGARPEQGLYTAIVAGALVSLFGGSRLQIAGPTGAFIALLSVITAQHGIVGLQIATLMAGLILLVMGLARMGAVIRYIPTPVIVGFTSGIAVIIFVGQWRDFLGLPKVGGEHFHEKVWQLMQVMPQLDPATLAVGAATLLVVIYSQRLPGMQRVPGPLTAMIVATVGVYALELDSVATIGSAFGGIPSTLPAPSLPEVTFAQVVTLIGPAFTIAMLGAIESLLSAVVADGMAGTRHDSNQELIGQGIANIAAPIFGGFAATGAIARTATNIRNGATGPLAGIVHAAFLIAVILFLAPLAAHIPLAALAAILFVVAWNMSEVGHFAHILKKAPRADRAILVITFVLTVFADLVVAVNVGVLLAVLHVIHRMTETFDAHPAGDDLLARHGVGTLPADTLVYDIEGPLFFGAVENLENALLSTHTEPKTLVIRMRLVPFMDITGIQTLENVIAKLAKRGIRVVICEANTRVRHKLEKAGVLGGDSPTRYADNLRDAVNAQAAG
ncbi:MAG: STAS domain-containing protein [Thiobacillus sp.]|nr:STAS domain-containing protein [Thiobacillus sp.]